MGDIFAYFILDSSNNFVATSVFAVGFKLADITPVFKKDLKTFKENFRLEIILPNVSKIFERILFQKTCS